jgi:hypothetical protein
MFPHLKAEDFVNLIEGAEPSARHRTHLNACARCRATWASMRSFHFEVTSLETDGSDIPEPDWAHFRSSVRDELLSRSIQRQSAVRRWTGWTIRPAVAWALSLLMAVGITTTVLLNRGEEVQPAIESTRVEPPPVESDVDLIEAGPERSLFDDVVSLGEEQQEQFRQMLESTESDTTYQR